jgi:hypothetical protein
MILGLLYADPANLSKIGGATKRLVNTVLKQGRHAFGDSQIADDLDGSAFLNQSFDLVRIDEKLVNAHPSLVSGLVTGVTTSL